LVAADALASGSAAVAAVADANIIKATAAHHCPKVNPNFEID
jgi:hypothetical protein